MLVLLILSHSLLSFFFFNDTPPTEIYTLSLHDALPISAAVRLGALVERAHRDAALVRLLVLVAVTPDREVQPLGKRGVPRSEEHTSELQSLAYLVCRLLLEKKKTNKDEKNMSK